MEPETKEKAKTEAKHEPTMDLVWGAKAIGAEMNVPPRKAFHLLQSGEIPGKKIGGTWASDRNRLRKRCVGEDV